MAAPLAHRGPGASGAWDWGDGRVACGHRSLSIVDLSAEGAQPMTSRDGALVLTYNGEIYNFASLRDELRALGCEFRGTSDSEVLIEAISTWDVSRALERVNG